MRPFAGTRYSIRRGVYCLLALGLAVLLLCAAAPAAHASIGGCRSDPVFLLSNGTELDLTAAIATDSSNVLGVAYALHIPTGIQVLSAIGWSLGAKEQWSVAADMPPGQYRTSTFVTTSLQGIAVQTTTEAIGLIGAAIRTVDGYNDQHLEVQVAL